MKITWLGGGENKYAAHKVLCKALYVTTVKDTITIRHQNPMNPLDSLLSLSHPHRFYFCAIHCFSSHLEETTQMCGDTIIVMSMHTFPNTVV